MMCVCHYYNNLEEWLLMSSPAFMIYTLDDHNDTDTLTVTMKRALAA